MFNGCRVLIADLTKHRQNSEREVLTHKYNMYIIGRRLLGTQRVLRPMNSRGKQAARPPTKVLKLAMRGGKKTTEGL